MINLVLSDIANSICLAVILKSLSIDVGACDLTDGAYWATRGIYIHKLTATVDCLKFSNYIVYS